MNWTYNNKEITINEDGKFVYNANTYNSLEEAKRAVDQDLNTYYNFTDSDCEEMKNKLSLREQEVLSQIAMAVIYPGAPMSSESRSFNLDLTKFIIGDIPMYEE